MEQARAPANSALILRSAALFAVLYQFRLIAADLADTPVFAVTVFASFAIPVLLARLRCTGGGGRRKQLGPLAALAAIGLIPWISRFVSRLPGCSFPAEPAALRSVSIHCSSTWTGITLSRSFRFTGLR